MIRRHTQAIVVLCVAVAGLTVSAATAPAPASTGLDITISPRQPLTLEDTTVEVQVNSSQQRQYLLSIDVLYRDRTVKQQQYRFELGAGDQTALQIPVTPTNIGNYTVAATLLDKKGQTVYTSTATDFSVVSDVGPFDLFITTPAQYTPSDVQIPVVVRAKNVGVSGVDTEINITSQCFQNQNRVRRFFVFVNRSGSAVDTTQIPSCNEPGAHTITATLSVFGEQQVSATTQYIEREDMHEPKIGVADTLTLKGKKTKTSVLVRNTADTTLQNLQPYVFGVPPSWVQITPHQITDIPPNGSATFVATITPEEPKKRNYDLLIGVNSPSTFAQKPVSLNIEDIQPRQPADEEDKKEPLVPLQAKKYVAQFLAVVAGLAVLLFAAGVGRWLRDEWKHRQEMSERLERVKEGFRTSEPSPGRPGAAAQTKRVQTVTSGEQEQRPQKTAPADTERAAAGRQGGKQPGMEEAERRFQQVLNEAEEYAKQELEEADTYAYEQRLQRLRERARSAETADELLDLLDRADRIFEQLQDNVGR